MRCVAIVQVHERKQLPYSSCWGNLRRQQEARHHSINIYIAITVMNKNTLMSTRLMCQTRGAGDTRELSPGCSPGRSGFVQSVPVYKYHVVRGARGYVGGAAVTLCQTARSTAGFDCCAVARKHGNLCAA